MLQTKHFFSKLNLFKIPLPNLLGWLTYLGSTTRKWTHYSMLKSILRLKKNDDILNNMVLVSFKRIPLSDLISNTGFSIASVLGTKKKSQKNLVIYNKILKRDYSIFISNTCRSTTRLCKKFIGISVHKRFVGGSGIKKGAETLGKALGENAGVIAPISTHTSNISTKKVEQPPLPQSSTPQPPQKITPVKPLTPALKEPNPLVNKDTQNTPETTKADLPKISLDEAIEIVKKPLYPNQEQSTHDNIIKLAKDMPLKKTIPKPIDTPGEFTTPQTGSKEQPIFEPVNINRNDVLDTHIFDNVPSLPLPLPIPLPPAVVPPPTLTPSPQIKSFQKSINEELKDLFEKNNENENKQHEQVQEKNNNEQIKKSINQEELELDSKKTSKEVLEELRKRKLIKINENNQNALDKRAYSYLPSKNLQKEQIHITNIPEDIDVNPFRIGLLQIVDLENNIAFKGIHTHTTVLYTTIEGKTILWGYLTSQNDENTTELSKNQPLAFIPTKKKQYLAVLEQPLIVEKLHIKDLPTVLKSEIDNPKKHLIDEKLPDMINQQNVGMEYISQPEIKHKLIKQFNEKTISTIKKSEGMLPVYDGKSVTAEDGKNIIINADTASEKRAEEDFKKYIKYKNQGQEKKILKTEEHLEKSDQKAYQKYLELKKEYENKSKNNAHSHN